MGFFQRIRLARHLRAVSTETLCKDLETIASLAREGATPYLGAFAVLVGEELTKRGA